MSALLAETSLALLLFLCLVLDLLLGSSFVLLVIDHAMVDLDLATLDVLQAHYLLLLRPFNKCIVIPSHDIVIETRRHELVVAEDDLGDAVSVRGQGLYLLARLHVPDTDHVVVTSAEEPAPMQEQAVDPAPMAHESLRVAPLEVV